jgi:2-methylaconitate cis-trans-isomerase PrpF
MDAHVNQTVRGSGTLTHRALQSVIMRGGTSRGPVLLASSLPNDQEERDRLVVRLIGGDTYQTDGLGGGNPTTSKVVIVKPAAKNQDHVDFDYAVGNIVVGHNSVDWSGTCGNMTATVPVFALEERLIPPAAASKLRLRNLSTSGLIETFIKDASNHVCGDEIIVRTAHLNPAGSVFGSVLPTAAAREQLVVDSRSYEASIIDVTHPYLFLRYDDVVGDNDVNDAAVVSLIERIRGAACVRLGIAKSPDEAMAVSPAVPRVVLLRSPDEDRTGLHIVAISMGKVIGSVPVTAALCLAAAQHLKYTLIAEIADGLQCQDELQVIAPAARLTAAAQIDADGRIMSAAVDRRVRSIMRGTAWV